MEEVLDELIREGGQKKDLELEAVVTTGTAVDDEHEKEMLTNNT